MADIHLEKHYYFDPVTKLKFLLRKNGDKEWFNISKKCRNCLQEFFVRAAHDHLQYCSRGCAAIALRDRWSKNMAYQRQKAIDQTGKNSHNQILSEKEMLRIWEQYRAHRGTISLERLFRDYGYTHPPESLKAVVGEHHYHEILKQFSRRPRRVESGRKCEYRAWKQLKDDGYYVMRSAGSKGVWDLIAFRASDHACRLIQVKTGHKPGGEEWKTLTQFTCPQGWKKELWIYYKYVPHPDVHSIP